jgi:thiamine monophosphate synthase
MHECGAAGLDVFYPIVPDADWLLRIVPLGVRTVQLRVKDAEPAEVRDQIAAGLTIARANGCQLIVNDYWREAIAAGADYVHLGRRISPAPMSRRSRPRGFASGSPPIARRSSRSR